MEYETIIEKIKASGIDVIYHVRPRCEVGGKRISAAAYANVCALAPLIVLSVSLKDGGSRATFILLHELAHMTALYTGRYTDDDAEEEIADTIATQLFNDMYPDLNIADATKRMPYKIVDLTNKDLMIDVVKGYHKAKEILGLN